jgi:hypothetical protein
MRLFINKINTIIFGTVIIFSSCNKDTFTDANINHNSPNAVTPSVLLSTVEGSLAYAQGGDMSRFTSMFTQQTMGASRQCQGYYGYVLTSQDVDGLWSNIFTSVLQNNDSLLTLSDRMRYTTYSGVSRVLKAYSLQLMVDCWGNIPYSEALKGVANTHPKYDSADSIYNSILKMCDDAIDSLSSAHTGAVVPGGEDIIYSGDAAKWTMFAHAIKARMYMHQSKGSTTMAQKALSEVALSFGAASDGAAYPFLGNSETSANPWYQFNSQRGDISFTSGTMIQNMLTSGDPRATILVDTSADALTPFYASITGTVEFITYEELQFIKAEATIATGGSLAAADTAYREGILSNMTKLSVAAADITTYLTAHGALSTSSDTAKMQIAGEAYKALYLNPEAWAWWRRTGVPSLTPVKGNMVPRRFLYPQSEYSYNAANTPTSTLFAPKVFWDK